MDAQQVTLLLRGEVTALRADLENLKKWFASTHKDALDEIEAEIEIAETSLESNPRAAEASADIARQLMITNLNVLPGD